MSILIGVESADFVYIKQQTGATSGNLSMQLDKLQSAGYISIEKIVKVCDRMLNKYKIVDFD